MFGAAHFDSNRIQEKLFDLRSPPLQNLAESRNRLNIVYLRPMPKKKAFTLKVMPYNREIVRTGKDL